MDSHRSGWTNSGHNPAIGTTVKARQYCRRKVGVRGLCDIRIGEFTDGQAERAFGLQKAKHTNMIISIV